MLSLDDVERRIPKNEEMKVRYADESDNIKYVTTYSIASDCFFVYEVADGYIKKIGRGKDPLSLESKYIFTKVNE